MTEHPDHFPPLMINMIKAGETGGFLDDALARIAKMYEADANLRAKIKSAMTYPVIVLIFSLLLGTGVIIFIVPIFEKMFKQLGGNLPLPTQIMVTLSHNMIWILPIAHRRHVRRLQGLPTRRCARASRSGSRSTSSSCACRCSASCSPSWRSAAGRATWARCSRSASRSSRRSRSSAARPATRSISEAMDDVRDTVRMGGQMSTALEKHPLFPSMVTQMMQVGEESGQITDMLDKLADYYDGEVETATDSLTSAMEPLLVVLLGAVIGTMVICLYLPMFSIYQHIQS